ncbi:response regulator transcription factor [Actinomadura yumaensis]
MAGSTWLYWITNGISCEGRYWLGRVLAAAPRPTRARAEALWAYAVLVMVRGADLDAARPFARELRELADELGAAEPRAWADNLDGQLALFASDAPAALESLGRAVAVLREYPAGGVLMQTYPLLASAHLLAGDVDRAVAVCEEGRGLGLRLGERWFSSYCVFTRGLARWMRGDAAAATADSRTCMRLQAGAHDLVGMAFLVDSLAWYAMDLGDARRAARLLGSARTVWDAVSRPHLGVRGFLALRERCEGKARLALGDEVFAVYAAEGAARPIEEVVAEETGVTRPAAAVARVPNGVRPPDRDGAWAPLTRREAEVARLVAEGLTDGEIAARLVIAPGTAEAHIEQIMAKLDVRSRTLIALWVAERRASG